MKGLILALIVMALSFLSVGLIGGLSGTLVGYYTHSVLYGMLAGAVVTGLFVFVTPRLPLPGLVAVCTQIVLLRVTTAGVVLDALCVCVASALGTFIALSIGGFWGVSLGTLTAAILGSVGTYLVSTYVRTATRPLI